MNKNWSNSILAVKMKQSLNYKLKLISRKPKFFQYFVCSPLFPVIYFRLSGMHFTRFLCTQDRFFPVTLLQPSSDLHHWELRDFLFVSNLAQNF